MAVPKRKTSKSKRDMRQAGKGLVKKNHIRIDKDGNVLLSHNTRIIREKKSKDNQEEKAENNNN